MGMPAVAGNFPPFPRGFQFMDMSFVWFLLIWLAAGWLAGQIVKGSGQGLITDIIVGVIGAMLGGVLFGMFGLEAAGTLGSLVTATVGAVVLLLLLRLINRSRPV